MKKCIKSVITGALGTAVWLIANTSNAQPQDRPQQGNFDPQLMRQRMTERMRAQFDVKDDTEWKAFAVRGGEADRRSIAHFALQSGAAAGGVLLNRRPEIVVGVAVLGRRLEVEGGPGGQDGPGGPPPQDGQGGPDGFGPPPGDAQAAPAQSPDNPPRPGAMRSSPELDALRKAIDNKASAAEIKSKLADLRTARKQKEAGLEKAQDDLKTILSARQEAVAVTLGLLK